MRADFYDLDSGLFTGRSFSGHQSAININTPPGCGAALNVKDAASQMVDIKTGEVVDYKPPAPTGNDGFEWIWSEQDRRWVVIPTLSAMKSIRISEFQMAIDAQEKSQHRPQRELMAALLNALPAPTVALNKMMSINNEVTRLRAMLTACAEAADQHQLNAVPRP